MKDLLITKLEELLREDMSEDSFTRAEEIKNDYLAACDKNNQELLAKFMEDGSLPQDFEPPKDPLDNRFNELMHILSDREKKQKQSSRDEQNDKLKAKQEIIEAMEKLGTDDESIGKAFQHFKELQNKWNDIGSLQHKDYKSMQAAYHRHSHNFYYNMKLSKDLRDLDFKRNHEQRELLLTKIESLVGMDNIRAAERLYRMYRMEWSELGPTAPETIDDLRNRFRELATQVQTKVSVHHQEQELEQTKNLEIKKDLLAKMTAIGEEKFENTKQFQTMNDRVQQLMDEWKKTGFASKSDNEKIWEDFKGAMNKFYSSRREFFATLKKEFKNNKDKKNAIITKVEAILAVNQESWEEPTREIIELQRQWKESGPVEHSEDNKLWTRFRSACDKFFEAKRAQFADRDKLHLENLEKKKDLVKRIEDYVSTGNTQNDIEALQNFGNEWREIEHVPFKEKQKIFDAYKKALDGKYNSLKLEQTQTHIMKFKTNIDMLAQSEGSGNILRKEKSFIQEKIKKIQSTITQYENNLGFFSNSKSMGGLLDEVQANLKKAKDEMDFLKNKLKLLNDAERKQEANSTAKAEVAENK